MKVLAWFAAALIVLLTLWFALAFMPGYAFLAFLGAWLFFLLGALLRDSPLAGVAASLHALCHAGFFLSYLVYWWSAPRLSDWWLVPRAIASLIGASIFGGIAFYCMTTLGGMAVALVVAGLKK